MLQQLAGSVIKSEEQCQVSCLKGQKLLPILQSANILAFVAFKCLTMGKQPLKHMGLVAILDADLATAPQQAKV